MPDVLSFAAELERLSEELFSSANIWREKHEALSPKVVAMCLLIRTLSNFRGGVILLRNRRIVESRIMARCCFENLFSVVALGEEGFKFIEALQEDDDGSRKSRAEFLLENAPLEVDERDEDPLRILLRQMKKERRRGRILTPKAIAARGSGSVGKAYAYYAELSADAAHPTLASLLGRYVNKNTEQQNITTLDLEPNVNTDEGSSTLFYLCEALLGVCVWTNTILENAMMEAPIQKLLDQYKEFIVPRSKSA